MRALSPDGCARSTFGLRRGSRRLHQENVIYLFEGFLERGLYRARELKVWAE
jgi:hypothetical protein